MDDPKTTADDTATVTDTDSSNDLTDACNSKDIDAEKSNSGSENVQIEDDVTKKEKVKPKWKLKIRVAGKNTENSESSDNDKEWEVISANEKSEDTGLKADSLKSPTSSRNASMIDALTPTELPAKRKIKRKSFDVVTITKPPNKKPKSGLRSDCPPFCKSNCTFTHHALLVCARKMIENDSATTMMFLDAVSSYYGGEESNMNPSDAIADPWRNTQLPLLHYIALMGKCAGCFAMIDAGHTPETVITGTGDNVLHTMVKEMYVFNCTHGHMDILLKKFYLLLKEFRDCLLLTDSSGKNPMHLCSQLISQTSELLKAASKKPPFRLYQFQKNMLNAMLEQFKIEELDSSMLNNIDYEGNTISHYLGEDRASNDMLNNIKIMGADFSVRNNFGKTIDETMEQASELPPLSILELAAYSAKGQKFKSANRKSGVSMVKTVKTNSSPQKIITPKTVKKQNKSTQELLMKPVGTAELLQPLSAAKLLPKPGKARLKITPTHKEKRERKIAKIAALEKRDMTLKENVMDSVADSIVKSDPTVAIDTPQIASLLKVISSPLHNVEIAAHNIPSPKLILPKPVLVAISTANTTVLTQVTPATKTTLSSTSSIQESRSDSVKIVLPTASSIQSSTPSIVAKVKPLTSKTNKSEQSKRVVKVSSSLSQHTTVVSTVMNNSQVNNLAQPIADFDPRKYLPMYINSNNNQATPVSHQTLAYDKPVLMKTSNGSYVQLSVGHLPNNQNNSAREGVFQQNQNSQTMALPSFRMGPPVRMMLNGGLPQRPNGQQMLPMNRPRPININGQWVYPITSPPGATLFPQGPVRFQTPPQMPPQSMLSPPPSMIHNTSPPGMPQMNTFFPHSQGSHPRQIINAPIRPAQQMFQLINPNPNLLVPNNKRAQNLEANIRNLKSVSMDIISTQAAQVSPDQNTKSPNQQIKSPEPAEEPVPPVYIIDTDDEQVIFPDDNINKQKVDGQQSDEHKTQETNSDAHKESLSERKCKYQVELKSDSCQHFENFLIANKLHYTKLECCEHEPCNEGDESRNRFLTRPQPNIVLDSCKLAMGLSEWLLQNTAQLCKKHFAMYVLSQDEQHLDEMLTINESHSAPLLLEEETKDWIKVEHFLNNERFRGMLSCSCSSFTDAVETQQQHQQQVAIFDGRMGNLREHSLITQQEVHTIAEELRRWLQSNPWVSQGYFAIHYLNRSQGTISNLLRWATAPTSKQGEEVWLRIKTFLEDKNIQESFALAARDKHKVQHPTLPPMNSGGMSSNRDTPPDVRSPSHTNFHHHRQLQLLQEQPESDQVPPPPHRKRQKEQPESDLPPQQHHFRFQEQSASEPLAPHSQQRFQEEHEHQHHWLQEQQESDTPHAPRVDSPPPTVPLVYTSFSQDDIHRLADRLINWLQRYPFVSQVRFSKHVLQRTQSTLSSLLKLRCVPISNAGQEVWYKIHEFLNDQSKQTSFLKTNYGWVKKEEKGSRHYHSDVWRRQFEHPEPDIPTQTVTPFKVQRLGEFDQAAVDELAERLKNWLELHPRVSQGFFAHTVLSRSQGTLSLLLTRKSAPISNSGEEVWRKIRDFLNDEQKQEDLLRLAYQL